jgi:hypothetical protein
MGINVFCIFEIRMILFFILLTFLFKSRCRSPSKHQCENLKSHNLPLCMSLFKDGMYRPLFLIISLFSMHLSYTAYQNCFFNSQHGVKNFSIMFKT